ncbi:MAG: HEAT repeat domain-containing protein [Candidatus Obscuribacterales bacterium]|nr:HEAT repeat domain-containing protein [Candidatus Obscuribacterales bacterium]
MDKEIASLTKAEKEEVIKELVAYLRSSDWQKQEKAAYMAASLGPDALPLLPYLISAMNSEMENVAWEAIPAIGKIGKSAVVTLMVYLKRENINSRQAHHLIGALGAIGPDALPAVPTLCPFLADGANTGAVDALKKIGPSCIASLAASLATAKDSRIWVYSCEIFSAFPAQSASALAELLKSKEDVRLKPATYVLSQIADPSYASCITGLIDALIQNKAEISDCAQEALIRIGPAASAALKKHALDDDFEIQKRVASVLQKIGKSGKTDLSYMQKGLTNNNPEAAALTAITILKNDRNNQAAFKVLINMLKSNDERSRCTACRACASIGPNAVGTVSMLTALLKDPRPEVRMEAATALGAIGPGSSSATSALILAVTSKHPVIVQSHEAIGMDTGIQNAAITALGQIGPKAAAAVPTLTAMLASKENAYRSEYILKALQGMKSAAAPALPCLIKCWQDDTFSKGLLLETFRSIGAQSARAIPLLSQSLANPHASYRKDIFETILYLESDPEKKRAFVSKYLKNPDYELSHAASRAYARLPANEKALSDLPALLAGLSSSQYDIKLNSIKSLGKLGPAARTALPVLIKENIGGSYIQDQKTLAFEAIKSIDPSGDEVILLLKKALEDPFQVRGACELLEFIGSSKTKPIATATRSKWKLHP